jgi:vacuolar-type H+-ATPase subunit H
LASAGASAIEVTIATLGEMEKELDALKAKVEEFKREIQGLARAEVERAKADAIRLAEDEARHLLERTRLAAEVEATKIRARADETLKALGARIDERFDRAVDEVVKAVLGE